MSSRRAGKMHGSIVVHGFEEESTMDRARSGQKTCYRSWDVATGMSGTGGNNGREQKRVGETRPATARSTSLEKNIEAEATRFFRFATCQHVIWENVIQKDLEETTKRHPKKQRARIDMPGWQVLVFPLCIRYVYPMT